MRNQKKYRILALLLVVSCLLTAFNYTEVNAAGKKVYVYVLQSKTQNGYKTTYKYNKYGLITKQTSGEEVFNYKYDSKKRMKECESLPIPGTIRHSTVTFSYDKKGRISKMVSNGSHESNTYSISYTYNKDNQIDKDTEDFGYTPVNWNFKYNSKKQLISKSCGSSNYTYTYDKHGNLKSLDNSYNVTKFENKYNKKKKLIKCTTTTGATKNTITFKYKKIKVDKKYVKKIKQQQWALLNQDAQFILPTYF